MGFGSLGWLAIPGLFWELYLEPWVRAIGTIVALTATALGRMDPALLGILLAASIGLPILMSMTTVLLEAYATEAKLTHGSSQAFFCAPSLKTWGVASSMIFN